MDSRGKNINMIGQPLTVDGFEEREKIRECIKSYWAEHPYFLDMKEDILIYHDDIGLYDLETRCFYPLRYRIDLPEFRKMAVFSALDSLTYFRWRHQHRITLQDDYLPALRKAFDILVNYKAPPFSALKDTEPLTECIRILKEVIQSAEEELPELLTKDEE